MRAINFLTLGILVIFLVGCETDDRENRYPYYQFDSQDELLFIKYNYVPGQIITYENQFGEKLHFQVVLNERKKEGAYSRGTFSGGGGYLQSYYDNSIVQLEILENPGYDDYSKVNYYFSKNGGDFNVGINFPMWNVTSFGSIDELQNKVNIFNESFKDLERIQMKVNGHSFTEVISIYSGSDESENASVFGPLIQNVNKIFYDYEFGIVQFNDTAENEWKVIYPE